MNKIVLATRKYKVGYEVREELCRTEFTGGEILNRGDAEVGELEDLIEYRRQNGPFQHKEELKKVPGIGPKKFDAIKDYVIIE